MILVPLFFLKFLNRIRRRWCRSFKKAALAASRTETAMQVERKRNQTLSGLSNPK
jgi:hypothetical protein